MEIKIEMQYRKKWESCRCRLKIIAKPRKVQFAQTDDVLAPFNDRQLTQIWPYKYRGFGARIVILTTDLEISLV